ncbi:LOW QUALITY PROTEIN: hypothetical protein CRUP_037471 [Coryphaenoides rupestris]|nr:LOW QUALITY PROTEIN: hypothetical protein CRUP_037471 [Coryphaenoides rupestris]
MQVLQAVRAQLRGAYKGPGGMKLTVLLCMAASAAGRRSAPSRREPSPSEPRSGRRADSSSGACRLPTLLLRLGERFSIQLHGLHSEPHDPHRPPVRPGQTCCCGPATTTTAPPRPRPPAAAATVTAPCSCSSAGGRWRGSGKREEEEDSAEKEKRSDDPPISVLEMARAEQLAQQASDNRRMMDIFGK